jgi:WD40 repeat protein
VGLYNLELVGGKWNGRAVLWSASTYLGGVYDLEFSPDGQSLAAGCEEGVIVWDVRRGLLTPRFGFRAGNITSVAVHPGGGLLAVAGRKLEVWNLDSHRPFASFPDPPDGTKVVFSADGKLLLALVGGEVRRAWPVETPEKRMLYGHRAGVPAVVFSPDGRKVASVSKDQSARIWDVASGRLLRTCEVGALVEAVGFSPDGKLLATGDFAGSLYLWDAESGRLVAQAKGQGQGGGPLGQIWRLQFSTAGDYVAACGRGGVVAWDVPAAGALKDALLGPPIPLTRRFVVKPPTGSTVYDLAVHPAGADLVFLTDSNELYAYDGERRGVPRLLDGKMHTLLRGLHFDAAGRQLTFVTPRRTLGLRDWPAGSVRDTGHKVYQLGLDAAGRWAATSSSDREVVVYDLQGRPGAQQLLSLPAETGDAWCVAWSPDNTRLAVGLADGGVAVWDLEQVRAHLAEFDIAIPSTARPARAGPP